MTNTSSEEDAPHVPHEVVERVREKLNERKGTWKELQSKSNDAFTYRWLAAFAKRDIVDPSYTNLVALAKVLGIRIGVKRR